MQLEVLALQRQVRDRGFKRSQHRRCKHGQGRATFEQLTANSFGISNTRQGAKATAAQLAVSCDHACTAVLNCLNPSTVQLSTQEEQRLWKLRWDGGFRRPSAAREFPQRWHLILELVHGRCSARRMCVTQLASLSTSPTRSFLMLLCFL